MAVAEQTTVYPAPGSPESPVSLKPRYENFIGGHRVAPAEGAYSPNPSPATGQPFCEVARSTAHDIDLALDAAHAARESWGETSTIDRAKVLHAIADAIEANLEMLAGRGELDSERVTVVQGDLLEVLVRWAPAETRDGSAQPITVVATAQA